MSPLVVIFVSSICCTLSATDESSMIHVRIDQDFDQDALPTFEKMQGEANAALAKAQQYMEKVQKLGAEAAQARNPAAMQNIWTQAGEIASDMLMHSSNSASNAMTQALGSASGNNQYTTQVNAAKGALADAQAAHKLQMSQFQGHLTDASNLLTQASKAKDAAEIQKLMEQANQISKKMLAQTQEHMNNAVTSMTKHGVAAAKGTPLESHAEQTGAAIAKVQQQANEVAGQVQQQANAVQSQTETYLQQAQKAMLDMNPMTMLKGTPMADFVQQLQKSCNCLMLDLSSWTQMAKNMPTLPQGMSMNFATISENGEKWIKQFQDFANQARTAMEPFSTGPMPTNMAEAQDRIKKMTETLMQQMQKFSQAAGSSNAMLGPMVMQLQTMTPNFDMKKMAGQFDDFFNGKVFLSNLQELSNPPKVTGKPHDVVALSDWASRVNMQMLRSAADQMQVMVANLHKYNAELLNNEQFSKNPSMKEHGTEMNDRMKAAATAMRGLFDKTIEASGAAAKSASLITESIIKDSGNNPQKAVDAMREKLEAARSAATEYGRGLMQVAHTAQDLAMDEAQAAKKTSAQMMQEAMKNAKSEQMQKMTTKVVDSMEAFMKMLEAMKNIQREAERVTADSNENSAKVITDTLMKERDLMEAKFSKEKMDKMQKLFKDVQATRKDQGVAQEVMKGAQESMQNFGKTMQAVWGAGDQIGSLGGAIKAGMELAQNMAGNMKLPATMGGKGILDMSSVTMEMNALFERYQDALSKIASSNPAAKPLVDNLQKAMSTMKQVMQSYFDNVKKMSASASR